MLWALCALYCTMQLQYQLQTEGIHMVLVKNNFNLVTHLMAYTTAKC